MSTTGPSPRTRSALILYGSETGNSQEVAEELGALAERLHFTTHVAELDSIKVGALHTYTLTVFVVSTTGQGDFPANARSFWRSLLLKRLPGTFLSGVRFTLFGLGDSSYPKFNWAARKLYKRLLQLGAQQTFRIAEADQQHPEGYPLPVGKRPIPDEVPLPPKWVLKEPTGETESVTEEKPKPLENDSSEPGVDRLDHDVRPIPHSFTATLLQNTRVTPSTHWQDVRHIAFSVPTPLAYGPGDMIAIMPKNFAEDVQALVDRLGWAEHADKLVSLVPGDGLPAHDELPAPPIPDLGRYPRLTLRALLTDYLDIRAIPRRSFFSNISHYTSDERHQERLLEFTKPDFLDDFWDYTTRPRRSIIEVLQEFHSVQIPWQHAVSVFPVLRARQFSIASGGALKRMTDGSTRFELLVAIVKYRTVIKKIREGVCTRYLSVLRPGSTMQVQLQRGGLNSSTGQLLGPTVLIGPGTGVAPLRSMLWEKADQQPTIGGGNDDDDDGYGQAVLVFGGRNREADYFFADEWTQLAATMPLQVITAFSRDQPQKVYVQDAIREHASEVFRLLHELNGSVYICGSSGSMPRAVREALVDAFQHRGEFSREDAEEYLLKMEKITMASGLRILVPVKRVIDYAIKPRINKTQTGVETAGVKHSLNPFDELSVEEAVRLRERKGPMKVENILALSAGGPKCTDTLRTAMAMGADRAFHVEVPEKDGALEPLTVAKMLRGVVQAEQINLVVLGKQAIDGDQGQTGQMLAGLLGWPQATQASRVEIKDDQGTIEVTREVDGGVETLRTRLPMVITTDLRLNEPRYASLPNIMKAKKKPLEKKTLADFGVEDTRRLKTVKVTEPPARQGGGKVEDVDGLISKLKELGALN
ncbi:hypothetical protein ASPZODRAFT_149879 [Penicilliopsis zonata CBS 506.65]|uniref:NADPH-dependent diflavin oxidoreductase 1 n=1 Tax=Penicilliopsis zonata CBS 506.65 TaxID=1073090 RepID=A0A1L9SP68_9EURO|nr:hypothetical protein ASPZODRAFT_149879 [Penicilliopsis zonata CBS 506.65]OJJ48901.1 hypothetical protein ASPZODRAFT_149879 [Penicilliopsis zonata CBS 506.65]